MSTRDESEKDDKAEPKEERRSQEDRRVATRDRRGTNRVVTEAEPRRRNPDRRKN